MFNDVLLALMACALYRLLGRRLGHCPKIATLRTLFSKPVRASAIVALTTAAIVVTFSRRAHNPLLRSVAIWQWPAVVGCR